MTTTKCDNCNGEGIVGQGESPWLKQGHLETCKLCTGTGKIETADQPAGEGRTPEEAQAAAEADGSATPTTDTADGGEKKDEADAPSVAEDVPAVEPTEDAGIAGETEGATIPAEPQQLG